MTLALPGKSPRRKAALTVAAIFAVIGGLLLALGLSGHGPAHADNPNGCGASSGDGCIQVHKYLLGSNGKWQNQGVGQGPYTFEAATDSAFTQNDITFSNLQPSPGIPQQTFWIKEIGSPSGQVNAGWFQPDDAESSGNSKCNLQSTDGSTLTAQPFEVDSSAWSNTGDSTGILHLCAYNVEASQITVEKVANPAGVTVDSTTQFSGTLTYVSGYPTGTNQSWSVTGIGGSDNVSGIVPGTYTISESAPTNGWSLTGYALATRGACPTNASAYSATSPNISAPSGGSVVVCVMNLKQNGSVIVHKVADPDGAAPDNTKFSGMLSDGSSTGWGPIGFGASTSAISLSADTYTVTENTPSNGWTLVGFQVFTNGTTTCPSDSSGYSPSNDTAAVTAGNTTLVCVMNTKPSTTIQLAKSDDTNGLVAAGGSFHWNITVTVTGSNTSGTTTVTDAIPADFTLGTLPSGCSATGNNVTCTLPANTAAGAYTFSIPVTAPASTVAGVCGTTFTNTANITALGLSASDDVTVFCPGTSTVTIAKSDDTNGQAFPGGSFNWTITLTVSGASTAHAYSITDAVPAGLTAGTPTVSSATALDCSASSGNSIACTLASSTPTGSYTITIPVSVPDSADSCKAFTNQASLEVIEEETQVAPTLSNTDTVTIECATINVVKHLTPPTDPGTFNLFIKDSGNATVGSASAVGNGGSTGATTVVAGTYTVGETGANGTSLSGYASSVSCVDDANSDVVASGNGSTLGVTVSNGQAITCTITNDPVGSITVTKTEQLANGNTQPGNGWPITVSGCGISQTKNTTVNGTAVFTGLPPCTYTVSENTGAKGPNWSLAVGISNNQQVTLGAAGASGTANFVNIQEQPPCTVNCYPIITVTTPTTPTSTPTSTTTPSPSPSATPTTQTATPTPTGSGVLPIETPSATPTQGSGVLGEKTPIAPSAGSGTASGHGRLNLLYSALALLGVSGLLAMLALRRKLHDD